MYVGLSRPTCVSPASGGSKTQTVNPMVSGLTITQPTISLSRVDNPGALLRPSSTACVMAPISEDNPGAGDNAGPVGDADTPGASEAGAPNRSVDDSDGTLATGWRRLSMEERIHGESRRQFSLLESSKTVNSRWEKI